MVAERKTRFGLRQTLFRPQCHPNHQTALRQHQMHRFAVFVQERDPENPAAAVAVPVVDVGDAVQRFYNPGLRQIVARLFALFHGRQIARQDRARRARLNRTPVFQPEHAVPNGLNVRWRVGDENDRQPARPERVNFSHALVSEISISHRERLIHQQQFRIHVDRNRECQPHHHAARIGFHWLVDKIPYFREVFDLAISPVDLATRKTHDRPVQVYVVPPGELLIESRPQFCSAETRPLARTVPDVGRMMPAMIWSAVLLPDPLAPTRQKTSPRRISKLTSVRA